MSSDLVTVHRTMVRVATSADLDQLVRLHDLARTHVGSERGGAVLLGRDVRPLPIEVSLSEDLASPDRRVWLGCIGDEPVGLAIASLEDLHDGTRLAQVSELFVEPDARDIGVGAALMDALIAWAQEHGCTGVGSVVLPGDRASKNFFESFGLVARAILVHRELRSP